MVFEAIKAINHNKLNLEGYSSVYSLQPLKVDDPSEWSYGTKRNTLYKEIKSSVKHVR